MIFLLEKLDRLSDFLETLKQWFASLPEATRTTIGAIYIFAAITFLLIYDHIKGKKKYKKPEIEYRYDKDTKSFVPISPQQKTDTAEGSEKVNTSDEVFNTSWYRKIKNELPNESEFDWEADVIKYSKHFDIPGEYTGKYQKRLLLTKNEYYEYRKLKDYANERNLIVCPKVRLLDLIEPIRGQKGYKSLLRKVMSKHIDFVICNQNLHVKAVLELDDNSHNTEERMERDYFVNSILEDVGYTVIRTKGITETTLSILDKVEN